MYIYKQAHRTRRSSRRDEKMARVDRQKFSKVNVVLYENHYILTLENFCQGPGRQLATALILKSQYIVFLLHHNVLGRLLLSMLFLLQ
jgi:hypothetical protein